MPLLQEPKVQMFTLAQFLVSLLRKFNGQPSPCKHLYFWLLQQWHLPPPSLIPLTWPQLRPNSRLPLTMLPLVALLPNKLLLLFTKSLLSLPPLPLLSTIRIPMVCIMVIQALSTPMPAITLIPMELMPLTLTVPSLMPTTWAPSDTTSPTLSPLLLLWRLKHKCFVLFLSLIVGVKLILNCFWMHYLQIEITQ